MKNIILLTIDCLRYDHVIDEIMPNVCNLAKEGTVYNNCYSEYGHTMPSFQTLFEKEWIYKVKNAGYYTMGLNYNAYLSSKMGYSEGFDFYHDLLCHEGDPSFIDDSKELINIFLGHQFKPPFFLWLHLMDCHAPYYPYGWDREMRLVDVGAMTIKITKKVIKSLKSKYRGAVEYIDRNIGFLISELKRMDLYNNTMFIISADHGEEFYEHKKFGHASDRINEEVLHIPLIVKGNGICTIEEQCYFKEIEKIILKEIS